MKCYKCNKELDYKPIRIKIEKYTGTYRGYQTKYRFDLCKECYKEMVDIIKQSNIKPFKVEKREFD